MDGLEHLRSRELFKTRLAKPGEEDRFTFGVKQRNLWSPASYLDLNTGGLISYSIKSRARGIYSHVLDQGLPTGSRTAMRIRVRLPSPPNVTGCKTTRRRHPTLHILYFLLQAFGFVRMNAVRVYTCQRTPKPYGLQDAFVDEHSQRQVPSGVVPVARKARALAREVRQAQVGLRVAQGLVHECHVSKGGARGVDLGGTRGVSEGSRGRGVRTRWSEWSFRRSIGRKDGRTSLLSSMISV